MKRYILGILSVILLGIYGCSGGGGSVTSEGNTAPAEKASVTFTANFAPEGGIQTSALLSDIKEVTIYYGAGCQSYNYYDFESDYYDSFYEAGSYVYGCIKQDNVTLTVTSNSATINNLPIGSAKFVAVFKKDNGTVVDEVIAFGKLTKGKNVVYLPVLRGTWKFDSDVSLTLVNNLGSNGFDDNLSIQMTQINALQLLGRYERLDNSTLKNCNYSYYINTAELQFDNKSPYFSDWGNRYDNESNICGTPGINYTFDNKSYLFYNTNYWYYSNDGYSDRWYAQVLQFSGGTANANLIDIGASIEEYKVLDNGTFYVESSQVSTLAIDPLAVPQDYKAYTYWDNATGKIKGYILEAATKGYLNCSIYQWNYDNVSKTYKMQEYPLSSCIIGEATAISSSKSKKSISSSVVNKAVSKSISKSAFNPDSNIHSFTMNSREHHINWGYFCYDNSTKTARFDGYYYTDNSTCSVNEIRIMGDLVAKGTLNGKYRIVPFSATKQSSFDPANYIPGATIVDWLWKKAKPIYPY